MIRRAINNLPTRLHETFILHFYRELSHQEIAQLQEISYQNVCKRISQARAILREELRGYFIGKDGTDTDLSVTPMKAATKSAIGEMSQGNGGVEPIVGETVRLSVRVEEVESVVGEESIEVVLEVQHSDSTSVAATCEGKVEGNRDGCRCVEAALFDELPTATTLVLAQIDETRELGKFCLVVQRIQQQHQLGKVAGEFLLPSRSPTLYCFPYFQSLVKTVAGMIVRKGFCLGLIIRVKLLICVKYFAHPSNQDLEVIRQQRKANIKLIVAPFPDQQRSSNEFFGFVA